MIKPRFLLFIFFRPKYQAIGAIRRNKCQAIMEKACNGVLFLADIVLLVLKVLYYICESVYKFFVPTEEKSVVGEIVLVCIKYILTIYHNIELI